MATTKRTPLSVTQVLNEIERVLDGDDERVSLDLWNILTALRGPDDGSKEAKHAITVHIRRRAFPNVEVERCLWDDGSAARYASVQGNAFFAHEVDTNLPSEADCWSFNQPAHFQVHANCAREALNRIGR